MGWTFWGLFTLGVSMSSLGGLLLKMGAVDLEHSSSFLSIVFQIASSWKIVLGMLMYFIPVLIWIYLLKFVDLSFLQPLFSVMYVLTPLLSTSVLNETIPMARWVGIGIVCVGIMIIAQTGSRG
jgi:drug/metabolite transporter (DMT)-like permease